MSSLFGTSGIRGSADSFLTNQFCFDIGRSFSTFLDNYHQVGPIVLGMDPRDSGPRILNSFASGLIYSGRKVISAGYCPIPALNYILIKDSVAGSVMVSGSHIEKKMNGLKFFALKEEILKKHEQELENIFERINKNDAYKDLAEGVAQGKKAQKYYQEMLLNLADKPFPKWKIIVDCGNGAQAKFIPEVLKRLGLEVSSINNSVKEGFIARDTEIEDVFLDLQNQVIKQKADFGVAFDADGDRVVFINELGEFVPGDYTGALIAKNGNTKVVITPINTSEVVEYLGKPVVRTKVGSPFVVAAMRENGATFGFEANGGGISAEIMLSRDGGSSMIKILNLLKNHGRSFSSLIATLPRFFIYRTKVVCPRELNTLVLESAKKNFEGIKVEELDGLKIWLNETTWILFRPSSNAPEFRVFAEAKSEDQATELGQKGIELVKTAMKTLSLK